MGPFGVHGLAGRSAVRRPSASAWCATRHEQAHLPLETVLSFLLACRYGTTPRRELSSRTCRQQNATSGKHPLEFQCARVGGGGPGGADPAPRSSRTSRWAFTLWHSGGYGPCGWLDLPVLASRGLQPRRWHWLAQSAAVTALAIAFVAVGALDPPGRVGEQRLVPGCFPPGAAIALPPDP